MLNRIIAMRKLREILRLKFAANLSHSQIAAAVKTSSSSVSYYTRAAISAGITWPINSDIDDIKLLELLMPHCKQIQRKTPVKTKPNLAEVFKEMQNKNVTLQLLWEEYILANPNNNYSYSNFCLMYRKWCKTKKINMRQTHKPGDKCFIDYAGSTIPIYDQNSGKVIINAQLFIAVLGVSNFTYAEATSTQSLPDWLSSHVRAFEYFGGVPAMLIPDNLKSGIKDSCKYDPVANPSYTELAIHYNTTILPARPYTPKDKSKAEVGVQIAQRWIIAKLRHIKFYNINELNKEILLLLNLLNNKNFKKKEGSRHSQFIQLEKFALGKLPEKRYEQAYFKQITIRLDYHFEFEQHYYSVPYYLAGEIVESRYTQTTIEILHNNKRVTSHVRNYNKDQTTSLPEHMPPTHKFHYNWKPQIFLEWSKQIGTGVENAANIILNNKKHSEQIYRLYLGFKQLVKCYGDLRLNNACLRAIAINSVCYQSISSILKNCLDQQEFITEIKSSQINDHENIRGSEYYK